MSYWARLLIAIDQLANVIFGGWPDETLSSRAYRQHVAGKKSWPMHLINFIFVDGQHCKDAYDSERLNRQLPPEFRSET